MSICGTIYSLNFVWFWGRPAYTLLHGLARLLINVVSEVAMTCSSPVDVRAGPVGLPVEPWVNRARDVRTPHATLRLHVPSTLIYCVPR